MLPSIATIISTAEGNRVGDVQVYRAPQQYKLRPMISIQGPVGKRIADILNEKGGLMLDSSGRTVLVGVHWPAHITRLELPRVLAAISQGTLRVTFDQAALDHVQAFQKRLSKDAAMAGRRSHASALEAQARHHRPTVASEVERLVHEFEGNQPRTSDWLECFREAFDLIP